MATIGTITVGPGVHTLRISNVSTGELFLSPLDAAVVVGLEGVATVAASSSAEVTTYTALQSTSPSTAAGSASIGMTVGLSRTSSTAAASTTNLRVEVGVAGASAAVSAGPSLPKVLVNLSVSSAALALSYAEASVLQYVRGSSSLSASSSASLGSDAWLSSTATSVSAGFNCRIAAIVGLVGADSLEVVTSGDVGLQQRLAGASSLAASGLGKVDVGEPGFAFLESTSATSIETEASLTTEVALQGYSTLVESASRSLYVEVLLEGQAAPEVATSSSTSTSVGLGGVAYSLIDSDATPTLDVTLAGTSAAVARGIAEIRGFIFLTSNPQLEVGASGQVYVRQVLRGIGHADLDSSGTPVVEAGFVSSSAPRLTGSGRFKVEQLLEGATAAEVIPAPTVPTVLVRLRRSTSNLYVTSDVAVFVDSLLEGDGDLYLRSTSSILVEVPVEGDVSVLELSTSSSLDSYLGLRSRKEASVYSTSAFLALDQGLRGDIDVKVASSRSFLVQLLQLEASPVNIYVYDDSAQQLPVSGVTVGVFDPDTHHNLTFVHTDENGVAELLLPGGTYELRFFKSGYAFSGAASVEILGEEDPENPNGFEVTATKLGDYGVPSDPRLCRCTGRFVGQNNASRANLPVLIHAKMESGFEIPKVVDGNMVAEQTKHCRTDSRGVLNVDLLRGGDYYITFGGNDDVLWNFKVPDRASANLIELIHPAPVSLEWDQDDAPANVASTPVGYWIDVHMALTFSDYQLKEEGLETWMTLSSSDPAIAAVSFGANGASVRIRGLAPGTVTVQAQMREGFLPNRIPYPSVQQTALTITVTP